MEDHSMKSVLAAVIILLIISACNKTPAPDNNFSDVDSSMPAIETLPGDTAESEEDTTTYYEYRP